MKKLYISALCMLFGTALTAQVNVTFKVDVSVYTQNPDVTIAENGFRVAGTFSSNGGTVGGNAMSDWAPVDDYSAMTDEGNGVWSITVEFPSSSVGSELLYKFVNGDWGSNEGTEATSTIATDGCGVDDGSGNINRTLIIGDADETLEFCWDACAACAVTSIDETVASSTVQVAPNPVIDNVRFNYSLESNSNVSLVVYNSVGAQAMVVEAGTRAAGEHVVNASLSELSSGLYTYVFQAGDVQTTGKIIKQ